MKVEFKLDFVISSELFIIKEIYRILISIIPKLNPYIFCGKIIDEIDGTHTHNFNVKQNKKSILHLSRQNNVGFSKLNF